ncbi:MAG TPA: efflux RND transporter permease subunit [Clostridiales bacterium]|nr:efflux RND transporter permease subunit [Clostridiales bacterium]HQP69217.1 efflux RND transporter permease subunit [Clostridiales bacterium]
MYEALLKKPVAIIMFFLSLTTLGIIAFNYIPLELKPDTEYPTLIVSASWNNVSPETIETKVISPIESEVYTLDNVYKVTSSSQSSYGSITVEYERDTDMNFAYLALNEKLYQIKKDLPEPVRNRVYIRKYVPREELDESRELISYNIFGNIPTDELGDIIENDLKNDLLAVKGINSVEITGIPVNELRVLIDRKKAEFYGITISDLSLLYSYGNQVNAGEVTDDNGIEFTVSIDNDLKSMEELKKIVLKHSSGIPIRIEDIAEVVISNKDVSSIKRINGRESVDIAIFKEPGSNAISTCDEVYKVIEKFKTDQAIHQLKTEIKYDSTESIREEIGDIKIRGLISILIIVFVLVFFLRNVRLSAVIVISVAVSIFMSGFFLYFFNFTLNIVTLSGLVLSFGILVDNSVVVLENIVRLYNNGYDKFKAACEGTKEVLNPVLSSTLTTVVVFVPFLYMTGERRLYWVPLAIVVSVTLLSSFVVSVILTPLLTRFFLTEKYRSVIQKENTDDFKAYSRLLRFFINNRKIVIILTGVIFYLSFFLFDNYVDQGRRFSWNIENTVSVYISMPVGSTVDMADKIIKNFEERIIETGGYDNFTTTVTSQSAYLQINYSDEQYYTIEPFKMENELVSMAVNFSGPLIYIRNPLNQSGGYRSGGTTSKTYNSTLVLKGYDYEGLKREALKLEKFLGTNSRIGDVDITGTGSWWQSSDQFSYTIKIDRKKLANYNVNVSDLVREIRSSCGGSGTNIMFAGDEIEMNVKYSDFEHFNVKDLLDKTVIAGNASFRIKEVAEIRKEALMNEITKEDQSYTRYVRFDFNSSSKQADEFTNSIKENYPLPSGYKFDEEDRDYMTEKEKKEILWLILFATVLVFMVTASLYESVLHPFIIILSIPLSITGVFWVFFGLQEVFNEDAYMGVILLAGIVVNNSIILIYHINSKRASGLDMMHSIITGTTERIRPVLMTSITTILGVVPLIINSDAEKNFWYSFSIATIGGLSASTFFVLTVLPVMYAFFERVREQFTGFFISGKT